MPKYRFPTRAWLARLTTALAVLLAVALAFPAVSPTAAAQGPTLSQAVVLVNSGSTRYNDYVQLIQPYLDHLGIPYSKLDIATTPVTTSVGRYALIIIGHRQLDIANTQLDAKEESYIVDAVMGGSGLVNFDGDVANAGVGRYLFVDSIFGFEYQAPVIDYGVTFPSQPTKWGTVIECTVDANQNPVLPTLPSATTVDVADGLWSEMEYPPRPEPALMAGLDEEGLGLPVVHCLGHVPNGTYQVFADLYTGAFGYDLTYYYGYTAGDPRAQSVDTVGRSGGEDRFGEYSLGTVNIWDGTFDIYFQDADARAIPGAAASQPTHFGWSSIRLVPRGTPAPTMHWITERHDPDEWIGTGSLQMSGIAGIPRSSTVVAKSKIEPLVVATTSGGGRAVHWASYDWTSYAIKGPMYGLDDLVWRSLVWAAHKPFVMQGLPPFVTMRVIEAEGPFNWIQTANGYGFKPWVGLFYRLTTDRSTLADLTTTGMASAAVYAKNRNVRTTGGFYFDHDDGELPDGTISKNLARARAWHDTNGIPISRYVLPVFYEFGTNVFDDLQGWGVEFVGTVIQPGTQYPLVPPATPWLRGGPFRLSQTGDNYYGHPFYYADFLTISGQPALNDQFFNCITEIRDDAGFEWYPTDDVAGSIGRGTRQLKRGLDAMALASLNTTEPYIKRLAVGNMGEILKGIKDNLASYNVEGVTMDYACQYLRAMHSSQIAGGTYDPNAITVTLEGNTDMPTRFYLFTEGGGTIQQRMIDVPPFTSSKTVVVPLRPVPTIFSGVP